MFPAPDSRISCLLQNTSAHAALAEAIPPAGLLSQAERQRCDSFRILKRRRDWLLGRWTAKHLVWSYLVMAYDRSVPLQEIEILADADGAPYASIGERLPLSLSISHTGNDSFCGVCDLQVGHVGADIEQVEPREFSFVRTFFTPEENAAVEAALPPDRDRFITALWSAKEAVLKTLRLGLRADTRQVNIQIELPGSQWTPITVQVDPALLPHQDAAIRAWMQSDGTRIFSMALLTLG